jgi:hypothetical protein
VYKQKTEHELDNMLGLVHVFEPNPRKHSDLIVNFTVNSFSTLWLELKIETLKEIQCNQGGGVYIKYGGSTMTKVPEEMFMTDKNGDKGFDLSGTTTEMMFADCDTE